MDLGQHVDALGVFLHHLLETSNLDFDAAQLLEDRVLVVRVPGHRRAPSSSDIGRQTHNPPRYFCGRAIAASPSRRCRFIDRR